MSFSGKDQLDFIRKVVDETGPRLPTSPEEEQGAKMVAERYENITGKSANIEKFTCAPRASIASIPLLGYIILFIFMPLYIFLPLAAVIVGILVFVDATLQIFRYTGWLDFLFRKGESQNVYTVLEPRKGDPQYTILLGAHIDSSWGWKLPLKNPMQMWIKIPYGIVSGVIAIFIAVYRVISGNQTITWTNSWMLWILILFVPGWIYLANFMSWDKEKGSPGAMDNLSGIAVTSEVTKYLLSNPDEWPENCRIILVAFGSEEASLKGSGAFIKAHKEEYPNLWALIVDGVSDKEHFHVINGDTWLGTKYDEEFCNLAQESMEEVGVKPATKTENPVGGSDSASFSRENVRTVTLVAQDPNPTAYYHTINDLPDRLDPKVLETMDRIVLTLIRKIDECERDK